MRTVRTGSASGGPVGRVHDAGVRVRYAETDAQGIVNNAAYLLYFEVGRVEWLRAAGYTYAAMEREGFGFVVAEALVRYARPARFDDDLTVRTRLVRLGRVSLDFEYEVLREGAPLATGRTRHGCVDLASGRTSRIPDGLLRLRSDGRTAR
ncbi:TIGR00051: acyl-CoA thioester hydrolase, YbgC/YbaW family [Rubrobacter radiotolerans]|uniref:TIGR00051: acyl-CoA thioester hydrolase, YbgC/YbaW family n=1 Tax=Rubrobacter radiotolerans TaxID=42256 RepID=A0A023X534_RUBRA|nr:thioesterase family protein [Rubrobacter radiotolerans]AHY47341.1 TIGR00051: acyl-CoA thioester hydrolase, YbgC/YbaW family [Rubrobacter radiotolerans]MDX5894745.1 thioesterase family protein [Rubrobacter radiotolerans]SMC06671.1 acyl-CoA thioester hydrolase [Rubrobacter radiotolerans DSM 5868]